MLGIQVQAFLPLSNLNLKFRCAKPKPRISSLPELCPSRNLKILPVLSGVPESDRAQAGYVPSLNVPFRQSTLLGWRALARLNLSTLLWQNSRSRDTTYG